jgi:4-hydroxybenzoate polyprenyltransferase
LKLLKFLIETNLFIALAALAFTMESQVQLGIPSSFHPYLFIIFFATLFEYNLHRLITIVFHKNALKSPKHYWLREHLPAFYIIVSLSVLGFVVSIFYAKKEVLMALFPIAVLTLFYTLPIFRLRQKLLRLREIPGLKIFMIAFVWAAVTVLLPMIQSGQSFDAWHVAWMITERFFFIFAITIPFDIRDVEVDRISGLKTIPIMAGLKRAWQLAAWCIVLFIGLSVTHYFVNGDLGQMAACLISGIITFACLKIPKIRNWNYFHYGVLDGCILVQGALSLFFHYLQDFT